MTKKQVSRIFHYTRCITGMSYECIVMFFIISDYVVYNSFKHIHDRLTILTYGVKKPLWLSLIAALPLG